MCQTQVLSVTLYVGDRNLMDTPQEPEDKYREQVKHVPLIQMVTDETLLTEEDALAIAHDLTELGSKIPERTLKLVDVVIKDVQPRLEYIPDSDRFVVSPQELRGALAKMALLSSSQAVRDIGENMQVAYQLH